MKKYYCYGIQYSQSDRLIYRFEFKTERDEWVCQCSNHRFALAATSPLFRRIVRRINAGEEITFPVEV